MPKHIYEKVPLHPILRERAMQIEARYQASSIVPKSDQPADRIAALAPIAMKVIGERVQAYDRGELSVTDQKQLIAALKKIVRKYGDSN